MKKLVVQDTLVSLTTINDDDYSSLTDIAHVRNPDEPKDVVKNCLRNRSTVEYLGLWEKINNVVFKGVEFDAFRLQAGSPCRQNPSKFAKSVLRGLHYQTQSPKGKSVRFTQAKLFDVAVDRRKQAKTLSQWPWRPQFLCFQFVAHCVTN